MTCGALRAVSMDGRIIGSMRWPIALVMLAACGAPSRGADDDDDQPVGDAGVHDNGEVFEPEVTKVVIEIDYETGQEPFTGSTIGMGDTFDLSAANIDRLFAHKKDITLPRVLADMQDIGNVPDEELTLNDILAIADAHRDHVDGGDTKTYYLVFVSGLYTTNDGPQPQVLGVSIGNTGVIAMFKDVIRGTNVVGFPNVVRFVEQATIIHELGHAFGLVDNGVPMVAPHRDASHGAHCNNDKCVLYYLNEGSSDATAYVMDKVLTGNTILFDQNCLNDADAITGGL